jgi:PAS domain S-box-containing protein
MDSVLNDNDRSRKLERLNLVLRTVRRVNQLLVKEKNRYRLIQGVCDNLIQNRGYYNAWIALFDESRRLVAIAEAGLGEKFVPMAEVLKRGILTDCGRKTLSRPGVVITRDPPSVCMDCPLSASYGGRGAMTIRLEHEGKVYGILSASIPRYFIEDREEAALFEEIAGDIAFALYSLQLNEERKQAQEALEESEKRFRHLIENSLVGICMIQEGEVLYQNPAQEKLLGSLPRAPQLTDFESIHPEDVEKVKAFYQNIRSGKVQTQEIDFRFYPMNEADNGQSMKWVNCRASAVEYGGKPALLVNMMDISRAREMEHLARVQDKMSSLGRVAAGVAHEIRNPLSGMNIYLNTLQKIYNRGERLDKVREILDQLLSASQKIESIITRVMDFARPSTPKFALTNLNQPIDEAIHLSAVTLRKSGIKVELSLAERLPPCRADAHLIEQVVLNLITNAAEAMKHVEGEKRLEVTSSSENGRISVRVSDSGPCVPPILKAKVFDPFYSTKNGSTGLGLSLAQRIIADHGGSLEVFESKWGGAQFVLEIPAKMRKDGE